MSIDIEIYIWCCFLLYEYDCLVLQAIEGMVIEATFENAWGLGSKDLILGHTNEHVWNDKCIRYRGFHAYIYNRAY